MFQNIFEYLKHGFKHPITQGIFRVMSIISLTSTCITIGGFLLYTIGYSFLYGYYFSGTNTLSIGLIDLLILNIPFPFYSVIITSFTFVLIIIIFTLILYFLAIVGKQLFTKGERITGFPFLLITIIGLTIFQIALMTFFVSEPHYSLTVWLRSSLLWAGPFLIALFVYLSIQMSRGILSALSGLLYGSLGAAIIFTVLKINTETAGFWLYTLFGVAFIFSFFEHLRKYLLYRFILWLPMTVLVYLLLAFELFPKLQPINIFQLIITFIIILLLTFCIAFFIDTTKKRANKDVLKNKSDALLKNKIKPIVLFLILVFLSFTMTLLPKISGLSGNFLRTIISTSERGTVIYNNFTTIENSSLVAQKDGIYYISNSNWELTILKADQLRIDTKHLK
ncbi:hypothetical protein [Paenibacillus hexagrammi]|uniref:Uncharacterized protein n=1 Tax=Paenibacillus hexagrammi TaxID=2908839 RepID=A0ABY3SI76_9BACL|nr:hypothetical protein [Paenibacillus sp. YPD9-1]UJF33734.1 hypothetical protein L0M14_00240 [Paenibacillus sp. YPD9-1]